MIPLAGAHTIFDVIIWGSLFNHKQTPKPNMTLHLAIDINKYVLFALHNVQYM